MESIFGQRISGLQVDGRELHAAVFNEHEVRAAAGVTLVVGAVAFSYAYFEQQYVPLQVVATFFFVEFLIRVTVGLQYSPIGLVVLVGLTWSFFQHLLSGIRHLVTDTGAAFELGVNKTSAILTIVGSLLLTVLLWAWLLGFVK